MLRVSSLESPSAKSIEKFLYLISVKEISRLFIVLEESLVETKNWTKGKYYYFY